MEEMNEYIVLGDEGVSRAKWTLHGQSPQQPLLQDAANATLRSETLRETVCDAIIANGVV